MSKTKIEELLTRYGTFHEDELVAVEPNGNDLRLRIVQKTCADREADRQIVREAELICKSIVCITMEAKEADGDDYQDVALDWSSPFQHFDITIIQLKGSTGFGTESVVIYWEGSIDDRFFASAKTEITAKDIDVEVVENDLNEKRAEQNDAREPD